MHARSRSSKAEDGMNTVIRRLLVDAASGFCMSEMEGRGKWLVLSFNACVSFFQRCFLLRGVGIIIGLLSLEEVLCIQSDISSLIVFSPFF